MDESFAYQAATASAQNQMAFQERMSNTAYQRAVADAKAAGLNPWIVAHGQGATTPTGAEGDYGDQAKAFDAIATANAQSARLAEQAISAMQNVVKSVSSGSGRSGNSSSTGNGFLRDLIDSLPSSGSTELLGIRLPNSVWKFLGNAALDKLPELSSLKDSFDVDLSALNNLTSSAEHVSNSEVYSSADYDDTSINARQRLMSQYGVDKGLMIYNRRVQYNRYVTDHLGEPKYHHYDRNGNRID